MLRENSRKRQPGGGGNLFLPVPTPTMVYVLGVLLQDHKLAKVRNSNFPLYLVVNKLKYLHNQRALTAFYGVGPAVASKLCARLQIHDTCKVRQLTPAQVTGLASFLSSPMTSPHIPRNRLAKPSFIPLGPETPLGEIRASAATIAKERAASTSTSASAPESTDPDSGVTALQKLLKSDPLRGIKVESELRREVRENIAHQRMIGSYVGKRHAMGLPVRGQNTQSNAKTARKLNRVERFG